MKVSLNWVQEFAEIDLTVDQLVEKIGTQLGAVDSLEDIGKKYESTVVVEVRNCEKHPGADKLSVCIVDDGGVVKGVDRLEGGYVQIVCGAPNVRAGMLAAWIPPGAVVPSTLGKEPFKIEAREIRGVVSNGMLASAKELGLGESHEGLLEIDVKVKLGSTFADAYKLNDHIVDIENKMFTHRPDCFGMLGVARELAGVQMRSFKSPDWYKQDSGLPTIVATSLKLGVDNEIPELVPRFCLLPISDIQVAPSPVWLQAKLANVGVRPINNIVDITNYFMLETGQPLHAYDYDKLETGKIGVRLSSEGEQLKLIGGKDLKIQPGAIVITDGHKPIGLGGIMGGANTEVDDSTTNIVIECGTFDMNATRRTAMAHGLFTDAATRFTKGQSPLQNRAVITKAADDIIRIAGGGVAGALLDKTFELPHLPVVSLSAKFINERLGLELKAEQIEKILTNVEFKVSRQRDELEITAPFWRTDIEIAEDIVEEVGRLYGYDHLPLNLPGRDLSPAAKDKTLDFKQRLRGIMSAAGANEVLTYSFVHGSLLTKAGQNPADAYKLRNALSPDLQYYRLSLVPSLLDKVHSNIKQSHDKFVLFELGKTHNKLHPTNGQEKVPKEFDTLAAVLAIKDLAVAKNAGAAFYHARAFLDNLANRLGISFVYAPLPQMPDMPIVRPYDVNRTATISIKETNTFVGIVGEFRAEVGTGFKLPKYCAGFEIGVTELLSGLPGAQLYVPISKYPTVHQDITLAVSADKSFAEVAECLETQLTKNKAKHLVGTLRPLGTYKKDNDKFNYSFRLVISSYEKTLVAEEVNALLDKMADGAKTHLNAIRV